MATNSESPIFANSERTRCEIWSRVMGYHRPVDHWNAGKLSEHKERKNFRESRIHSDLNKLRESYNG